MLLLRYLDGGYQDDLERRSTTMKNVKQRMIEDMKLSGLAPRTQDRYLHAINALTEHYDRPNRKCIYSGLTLSN